MANNYTEFSAALYLENEAEEEWWKRHLEFDMDHAFTDEHFENGSDDHAEHTVHNAKTDEARLFALLVIENGCDWYEFTYDIKKDDDKKYVWFHTEEYGSPYQVACLVQAFFEQMRPEGDDVFELSWADTCDSPRVGEFGGGMMVATKVGVGTCNVEDQMQYCLEHLIHPTKGETPRKKVLYAVTYSHAHGTDVWCCDTKKEAEDSVIETMYLWLSDWEDHEDYERLKDALDKGAIDTALTIWSNHPKVESFEIHECELRGVG